VEFVEENCAPDVCVYSQQGVFSANEEEQNGTDRVEYVMVLVNAASLQSLLQIWPHLFKIEQNRIKAVRNLK